MPTPNHSSTEWRVCAQHIESEWLGWNVKVYVRSVTPGEDPGPWRMIKDVTYRVPNGQVKRDYWKELIRAAAK